MFNIIYSLGRMENQNLCWLCCHAIPDKTLRMPYKHDSKTNKFYTMGQFCSWSCMKTFNFERNRPDCGVVAMNITALRRKMYGKLTPVTPAPRRWALKCFGGALSIDEFREASNTGATVWIDMPNEVKMVQRVHKPNTILFDNRAVGSGETDVSIASRKHMMKAIKTADTQPETLKLKRPIPLKSNQSTLENSLGLTLKKSSRK
jgi:hypothetical protein